MSSAERRPESRAPSAPPVSGPAVATLPACVGAMAERAAAAPPRLSVRQVAERILQPLREHEPSAAVGLRLAQDESTTGSLTIRLAPLAADARTLVELGQPAAPSRLFPQLPLERSVPLPLAGLAGSLHWAGPESFGAGEPSGASDRLLRAAAAILAVAIDRARITRELGALQEEALDLHRLGSIGQLAAGIVHDLNNPLTNIVGYVDLLRLKLRRSDAPPSDQEGLLRINEAAERVRGLARGLIDFARPAAERPEPLALQQVVEQALSFCAHELRSAEAKVERDFQPVPLVRGRETRLTQLFVNLFVNAAHAMSRAAGGTLRIDIRSQPAPADAPASGEPWVMVAVADEGAGIDEQQRERIFEPFFTTKRRGRGVGLGLSIARQVVEEHGGRIRAENRLPQGAVFYIELPAGTGSGSVRSAADAPCDPE